MLPQQIPTVIRWLQDCAAEVEARQRADMSVPLLLVPASPPADNAAPA
jgi:hypothetical protein